MANDGSKSFSMATQLGRFDPKSVRVRLYSRHCQNHRPLDRQRRQSKVNSALRFSGRRNGVDRVTKSRTQWTGAIISASGRSARHGRRKALGAGARCHGPPSARRPGTAGDHRGAGRRLARAPPMIPARASRGWGRRQWLPPQSASGDLAGGWQHPLGCLTEEREHAEDPGLHWSRKQQQKLGHLEG